MSKPATLDPAVLEYIAEGKEIIERVSKNLSVIEKGSFDNETLASLYRDVHTLKGSSQLFGFKLTAQVSHALEACLDPVRKGKMKIGPLMMQACIKNIDLLDRLIQSIEANGKEFEHEDEIVKLVSLLVEASTLDDKSGLNIPKDVLRIEKKENLPTYQASEASGKVDAVEAKNVIELPTSVLNQNLGTTIPSQTSTPASTPGATPAEATIRVQVNLLDRILNLVGELVLVRNQLVQYRNKIDDADFLSTSKSLDVVTSDLQGEIMKTRMQPIETVIGKFQR